MKPIHLASLLIALLGILLTACNGQEEKTLADLLPLDKTKPTFLFFYTDG
jgi:hypothetical protein